MLVIDGAMGTLLQAHGLSEDDYRGERLKGWPKDVKGNHELLNLSRPDLVEAAHREYLAAGADIVETNTFNANRISQADYGTEALVHDINVAAARAARKAVDAATAEEPDRPRWVAGALGPTNKTASLSRDVNDPGARAVSYAELEAAYHEQALGLIDGGVDLLLVETAFDTLNAKAALAGVVRALDERGASLPVMASVTITDLSGRNLSGQTVDAFWISVMHVPLFSVGVNCALGPREMRAHVEELSKLSPKFVSAYPNAGLPNAFGGFDETPESMARDLGEWAKSGLVNVVGGCCGTTPAHIRAIAGAVRGVKPRVRPQIAPLSRFSGIDPLVIRPDSNFVNVGERTNVTGSPRFAKLVLAGQYAEALEIARQQVVGGAQILDVNMDEGLLDSVAAMRKFLNLLAAEPDIARVPIMVDSSDFRVIEAGLACLQGKGIVNSISLKEGEDAFRDHARVVRRYGAGVVVMAFDEEGQATDVERRVAILSRAYRILTEEIGFPPEDIVFDPNVLTVGTGIEEHADYAVSFIEATRRLKVLFPLAKVSGGISNVSFAFRGMNAVREAMHASFLYHAIAAGLDMGIVNSERLAVYEEIPKELLEHVEDVLLNRRPDATERLVAFAQTVGEREKGPGRRGRLAPGHGRGAHHARARARRGRLRRVRHRGGAPEVRPAARRDRGPADGRDERGGRPLRLRQDVPAAGREERPCHEEGRRLPDALPGEGEAGERRPVRGQDRARHGQGRRPRHRQEHRGRGPAVQQLRDRRPRRDGAVRQDPGSGARLGRRHRGPFRPDHAVARGDGPRGARDGPPGLHQAPADRRRDHEPDAHRRQDRAGLQRARRPRARRLARGGRRRPAQGRREAERPRRRRTAASRSGCAASTSRASRSSRC